MNDVLIYAPSAAVGVIGAGLLFKGRAVADWVVRTYHDQRITDHFAMPGFVVSLRVVGAGWIAFALLVFASAIKSLISNMG